MRSRGFKDRPGSAPGRPAPKGHGKDGKPGTGARGFKDRPGGSSVSVRPRDARPVEAAAADEPKSERIAKRLARAGIASRREAETIIAAGRVSVNGKVLDSPAVNVMPTDRIMLDGRDIPAIERTRLWLYHKPAGLVTSNRDPEGRATVFDSLPTDLPRVMSVGRLDINTEGLLLLTNDGGLARVLELPQTGWLRRYRVRAHGSVDQKALDGLKNGIAVDGVFYGSIQATLEREQGSNVWIEMALREGKNREIKNVLGALGLDVNRLIRVSYGPFQLGELPEGHVLEIKGKVLRDQLGEALVEQSGANFDAPVINQFPNKAVSRRSEEREREAARAPHQGRVNKRGEWISNSREGQREPLERLQTKPQRSRSSNVWMAPGARPTTAKSAKSEPKKAGPEAAERPKTQGDRPKGGKPPAGKSFGAKPGGKSFGGKPGSRPFGGKPGAKPRGGKPGGRDRG